MERLLYLVGGCLFAGAVIAHLYVRMRMKSEDSTEDVYWEFEENEPNYARHTMALKTSLAVGCLGILLLFLAFAF
ncbi:hypothetical protein ACFL6U_19310 [Planctomycetota bacterium]